MPGRYSRVQLDSAESFGTTPILMQSRADARAANILKLGSQRRMGFAANRIIQRTDTQDVYANTELVVFLGFASVFFKAFS